MEMCRGYTTYETEQTCIRSVVLQLNFKCVVFDGVRCEQLPCLSYRSVLILMLWGNELLGLISGREFFKTL
jgi:hypothetical protein